MLSLNVVVVAVDLETFIGKAALVVVVELESAD
jgi:hypothetical protein